MGEDENDESSLSEDSEEESSSPLSELADQVTKRSENSLLGPDDSSKPLSDLAESVQEQQGSREDFETLEDSSEWDLIDQSADSSKPRETADPKTEAILELVGDASNVLVVGPTDCAAEQSLCSRMMASQANTAVNLLLVTVKQTPSEQLSILQNYLTNPVSNTVVIDPQTYSTNRSSSNYDGPVDIKPVPSATDLRRIGILISKVLVNWEENDSQTVMCIHSLSDLIELVDDNQLVFRFLHVLQGRVESAKVRSHYHFNPDRHDEQEVKMFSSLFDTILTFDEGGKITME
ncbi:hypothetical protein [Natrinema sp. H-ect4]|uniref:DUF7504 family protein n=1 Tax=Natrinema sp. H-ect4 TaxID=3242699 RepID=UPI0035A952C0